MDLPANSSDPLEARILALRQRQADSRTRTKLQLQRFYDMVERLAQTYDRTETDLAEAHRRMILAGRHDF